MVKEGVAAEWSSRILGLVDLINQPVVLLGAGSVQGQAYVEYALKAHNVVTVVDNPRRGQAFGHLSAIGDNELKDLLARRSDLVAVMCGCTDEAVAHFVGLWSEISPQPILSVHQALRRTPLPQEQIVTEPNVISAILNFAGRTGCYQEAASRRCLLSVLLHRLNLDRRWLDGVRLPLSQLYFDTDTINIGSAEVLVDGGGFDGDTVLAFVRRTGGRYRHIHSFEVDPENFRYLGKEGRSRSRRQYLSGWVMEPRR